MGLTPDDFKLTIMEEAHRLIYSAFAQSSSRALDERTSMWVIRMEAWRDLLLSGDFVRGVDAGTRRQRTLLGLQVRVTVDDEPDVPMIQLVMEPLGAPRPMTRRSENSKTER